MYTVSTLVCKKYNRGMCTFVLGCIAATMVSSALASKSTKLTSSPCSAATWVMYRRVPPYTSFTLKTCAPGPRDCRIVAVVAEPDENAKACAPPDSNDANVDSRALRFGLPEREYSKPCQTFNIVTTLKFLVLTLWIPTPYCL